MENLTLKQYSDALAAFLAEHPEAAELPVVTSVDDEGNGFRLVYFTPALGRYDDGDFSSEVEAAEVNAVCVN